jgi:hypothetical protein
VHNIAIDPLDENYFISAGSPGDPTVTVWDQRFVKQRSTGDAAQSGAVLEFRPLVDNSQANTTIWSLRYSGTKRATFGALANTGEFKVVELARHSHRSINHQGSHNGPSAQAWISPHYTKISHHLSNPMLAERHRKDEQYRVTAYDFMITGSPHASPCALALHSNRDIEILRVPEPPPRINVTALEEIFRDRTVVAKPSLSHSTIAKDLLELQVKASGEPHTASSDSQESITARLDKLSIDYPQRDITEHPATQSSYQKHEDLLTLGYPDVKMALPEYLKTLQTQKRRCKEGYNLDCHRNKEIVANDPWLVDAWNLVARMDTHAWGDGMVGGGIDLKYLGVKAIWENKLTMYDQRLIDPDATTSERIFADAVKEICENKEFPPFSGVEDTRFPANRQLCLSLCGWNLTRVGLRERCSVLVDNKQFYKAIVLAVFQGYKDVALDLLKETIQRNQLHNIGLGAVIACDSVNEDQRHMCSWMADVTDEPYLKGLLAYFISGDWRSVVEMTQLSLADRVGVALKYLPDEQLTLFLKLAAVKCVNKGSIEGLLLTGLTERAMDLFENYISRYGDLQSTVLILSRACPLFIQDDRWPIWKDMYLNQMQVWRAFLERTHYVKEHNLLCVSREGRSLNKPSSPSLAIRCHNCQQNLALRKEPKTAKQYLVPVQDRSKPHHTGPQPRPHPLKGTASSPALACPNCNAQMPRCGLCMMWLGSPDPSKVGAAQTLKEEDLEARLMVFCMTCTHGFHGHHARDWFARHAMCPVPDCQCMCGLLK